MPGILSEGSASSPTPGVQHRRDADLRTSRLGSAAIVSVVSADSLNSRS